MSVTTFDVGFVVAAHVWFYALCAGMYVGARRLTNQQWRVAHTCILLTGSGVVLSGVAPYVAAVTRVLSGAIHPLVLVFPVLLALLDLVALVCAVHRRALTMDDYVLYVANLYALDAQQLRERCAHHNLRQLPLSEMRPLSADETTAATEYFDRLFASFAQADMPLQTRLLLRELQSLDHSVTGSLDFEEYARVVPQ